MAEFKINADEFFTKADTEALRLIAEIGSHEAWEGVYRNGFYAQKADESTASLNTLINIVATLKGTDRDEEARRMREQAWERKEELLPLNSLFAAPVRFI